MRASPHASLNPKASPVYEPARPLRSIRVHDKLFFSVINLGLFCYQEIVSASKKNRYSLSDFTDLGRILIRSLTLRETTYFVVTFRRQFGLVQRVVE